VPSLRFRFTPVHPDGNRIAPGRAETHVTLVRVTCGHACVSKRCNQRNDKECTMDARLNLFDNPIAGKMLKYVTSASKVITDSTLPAATQQLVALRASQINGCGFCT